jgi:transposase InsO family protein
VLWLPKNRAALRHQGLVVNSKKLRRLMREHDLQPKQRRRYVVTTDSDHAGPIYPDLAKDIVPDGPNQLWVADLTYVAIPGGFVYLAAILDAWSRKVVGYAISRSMDARIAVAALKAAIRNRAPPKGCIHHFDRGSQYASEAYRTLLAAHSLTGSMSRRGNPYDNAKAENFMKTLKVEAVYLRPTRRSSTSLPIFHASLRKSTTQDGCTRPSAISAPCSPKIYTPGRRSKRRLDSVHPEGRTPSGGHYSPRIYIQNRASAILAARSPPTALNATARHPAPV